MEKYVWLLFIWCEGDLMSWKVYERKEMALCEVIRIVGKFECGWKWRRIGDELSWVESGGDKLEIKKCKVE